MYQENVESTISLEEIRRFLMQNGGKVPNRELVKHFKKYLTDPASKHDARNKFKHYVNQLATTKTENDEKYVILRKYALTPSDPGMLSPNPLISPVRQPPPYRHPPQVSSPMSPTPSVDSSSYQYRDDVSYDNISQLSIFSDTSSRNTIYPEQNLPQQSTQPPQVPPRRRSSTDKVIKGIEQTYISQQNADVKQENIQMESNDNEQKISVRERMQKFNQLATETDAKSPTGPLTSPSSAVILRKKSDQKGVDEEDGVSVTSLDPRSREWFVRASVPDYQALAKLASENPRLVRYKDPVTGYTALHWAAKHGNENVVKLIAGTYKADVNAKTNGGYTPLHLAIQFGHENVFKLLVTLYKADPTIRDWSGRIARNYLQTINKSVSNETFRKIKARRKHSERDLSFLRIGSLNVRVKKTTEAFSNFLGVGSSTSGLPNQSSANTSNEKIHKSWGSADNLPQQKMLPPKNSVSHLKKRKSKRGSEDFFPSGGTVSQSTPSTPNESRSTHGFQNRPHSTSAAPILKAGDSDSDTACGFDSNWQTILD